MKRPVRLDIIVQAMQLSGASEELYLNTRTGELIRHSETELDPAEPNGDVYLVMQEDISREIQDQVASDDFIQLPEVFELDEYQLMEEFCLTLKDDQLSYVMCKDIQGKGAFKRFKEDLDKYSLTDQWYEFRDKALRESARLWCEQQGIDYIED